LTVAALLLTAGLVVAGTIYQSGNGIYAAQAEVFGSWLILLFGILPLPGMLLVAGLLFVNLVAASFFRWRYLWRQSGLLLIHYGLLLLVGGGFFIAATTQEYLLTLNEGESSRIALRAAAGEARPGRSPQQVALPFEVRLIDFEKRMHPGTDIPLSFSSRVEVVAGTDRRLAVISMNRPLRHRGYTFYQSSYGENERGGENSTFSVVRNSGRWLPYIASAMIFLGLLLHFLMRMAPALKKPRPAPGRP
jgi:hypothetical protein